MTARPYIVYSKALEACGYKKFISKHPKLAVEYLLQPITHLQLRNRMFMTAKLKPKEDFKKIFKTFVKELTAKAKLIARISAAKSYKASAEELVQFKPKLVKEAPPPKNKGSSSKHGECNKPGSVSKFDTPFYSNKRIRDLPGCLTRDVQKHFISDCELSTKEEKVCVHKKYREAKRRKKSEENIDNKSGGSVNVLTVSPTNTSLLSASFCSGAMETFALADQGADGLTVPAFSNY